MSDCLHFEYTVRKISAANDGKGFIVYTRLYPLGYPKSLRVKGGVKAEKGELYVILIPVSDNLPFIRPFIIKWKLSTIAGRRLILLGENEIKLSDDHLNSKDWKNGIRLTLRELKDDQIINDDDSLKLVWSGQVSVSSHDVTRKGASLSSLPPAKMSLEEYPYDISTQGKETTKVNVFEQQSVPESEKPTCSGNEDILQLELLQSEDQSNPETVTSINKRQPESDDDPLADNLPEAMSAEQPATGIDFWAKLGDGNMQPSNLNLAEFVGNIWKSILPGGQASLTPTTSSATLEQLRVSNVINAQSTGERSNRMHPALEAMMMMFNSNFPMQQHGTRETCAGEAEMNSDNSERDNHSGRDTLSYEKARDEMQTHEATRGKSSIESALFAAAVDGDTERVRQLLEDDTAEINLQREDGKTALMIACTAGKTEVVQLLLDKGAIVDLGDKDGWSALMFASAQGDAEIVEQLIGKGADVNVSSNDGLTPLMIAASENNSDIVEILLKNWAIVTQQDRFGRTAVFTASSAGNDEIVKILLGSTEEPELCLETEMNPLIGAICNDQSDVVKVLLEMKANTNAKYYNMTALHIATFKNQTEIVGMLLEYDADIETRGGIEISPLIMATIFNNSKIVEMLLAKKANIETMIELRTVLQIMPAEIVDLFKDNFQLIASCLSSFIDPTILNLLQNVFSSSEIDQFTKEHAPNVLQRLRVTPLAVASFLGYTDLVKLLLQNGADVQAGITNELTILMCASLTSNIDTFEAILDYKDNLDVNVRQDTGLTALMIASYFGRADIVELLLKHSADISLQDNEGETALMNASQAGHEDIVKLLLKSGADANQSRNDGVTPLMLASRGGHTEIIKVLLDKNADTNKQTDTGVTALMLASWGGHVEAVEILLNRGADQEVLTNNGTTALMVACDRGYCKVVEMLTENNTDINKANNDGYTALMWACKMGHCDVVKRLLESGADIDTRESENGYSPLLVAHAHGKGDVVAVLLDFMTKKCKPSEISAIQPTPKTEADTEAERVLLQASPEHKISEELRIPESDQRQNIWSQLATFSFLSQPGVQLEQLFGILFKSSLTDRKNLFTAASHLTAPTLDCQALHLLTQYHEHQLCTT